MYSKIKCPYTKNLTKISSKEGKKIILNYIKFAYGGSSLVLDNICSLENMVKANELFFDKQSKIVRNIDGLTGPVDVNKQISQVLQFYPGNNTTYWENCRNPADGHCFYWALYRTLLAFNKIKKLPDKAIYKSLNHLDNPYANYINQVKDVGILRKAAFDLVSKREEPFHQVKDYELQIMKTGYIKGLEGVGVGPDGWASDLDMMASAIICDICIAVFQTSNIHTNRKEWVFFYPQNGTCSPIMCFSTNENNIHFNSLIPKVENMDEGISYKEDRNMEDDTLQYIHHNSEVLKYLKDKKNQIVNFVLELALTKERAVDILNILNDYINHDNYGSRLREMYLNEEDRLINLIHLIGFYLAIGKLNIPTNRSVIRKPGTKKPFYKTTDPFLIVSPLKWESLEDMVRATKFFKQKIIEDINKLNIPRVESLTEYIINELELSSELKESLKILYPSSQDLDNLVAIVKAQGERDFKTDEIELGTAASLSQVPPEDPGLKAALTASLSQIPSEEDAQLKAALAAIEDAELKEALDAISTSEQNEKAAAEKAAAEKAAAEKAAAEKAAAEKAAAEKAAAEKAAAEKAAAEKAAAEKATGEKPYKPTEPITKIEAQLDATIDPSKDINSEFKYNTLNINGITKICDDHLYVYNNELIEYQWNIYQLRYIVTKFLHLPTIDQYTKLELSPMCLCKLINDNITKIEIQGNLTDIEMGIVPIKTKNSININNLGGKLIKPIKLAENSSFFDESLVRYEHYKSIPETTAPKKTKKKFRKPSKLQVLVQQIPTHATEPTQ